MNFLYPLVIIVASVLLPRVWAHWSAALAFILYGTVLELNYYAVVPSYCTTHPELTIAAGDYFRQPVRFSGGGVSGGLLTAKLRQVGVQLKDASGALESLQALHENIIHSISSGLITTGLDGRITLVNAAAQRFWSARRRNCSARRCTSCFWIHCPRWNRSRRTAKCASTPPTKFPQNVAGAGGCINRCRSGANWGTFMSSTI